MEKQALIDLANSVYEEIFWANQYWAILKQYAAIKRVYSEELSYSPAFYNVVRIALYNALIMLLAKLYDKDKRAAGIRYLLDSCLKNIPLFPQYDCELPATAEDARYLPETAKCSYLCSRNSLQSDSHEANEKPVVVELTIAELFQYYQYKLSSISSLENLRKQRNLYYAHLSKDYDFERVTRENPISEQDIEQIISFSIEFCRTVIILLTGIVRAIEPVNIDDLENTLKMVQLGTDHQLNCQMKYAAE